MRDFALHLVVVPAERGAASPEEIQKEKAHDAESDSVVEDDTDPRPRHQLAEIVGTAHHRKQAARWHLVVRVLTRAPQLVTEHGACQ